MLHRSDGEFTGGIIGALTELRSYLAQHEYGAVVVVMDAGHPGFRKELAEENGKILHIKKDYKGGRDKSDKDFWMGVAFQLIHCSNFFTSLGIPVVNAAGFEADDLIAGIVAHAKNAPRSVIYSTDKDFKQLCGNKIFVYSKTKNEVWKTCPDNYLIYRAMVKDQSDNIAGVPGIGEVWADRIMHTLRCVGNFDNVASFMRVLEKTLPSFQGALRKKAQEVVKFHAVVSNSYNMMNLQLTAEDAWNKLSGQEGEYDLSEFTSLCREFEYDSLLMDLPSFKLPFERLYKSWLQTQNSLKE